MIPTSARHGLSSTACLLLSSALVHALFAPTATSAQPGSQLTQRWDQDVAGLGDVVENLDGFGRVLAVGDFDGDGHDDLAISAFSETLEGSPTLTVAGVVHVLYGTEAGGLSVADAQRWSFQHPDLAIFAQSNALFGETLVAGDFDNDLYDDLVVGAAHYDAPGVLDAGAIFVLKGSAAGLDGSSVTRIWEDDAAITGTPAIQDFFGDALAAGDLNGDLYDDVAVSITGQAVGPEANAGAVMLLYGSATGLSVDSELVFDQTNLGDTPEGDAFGQALLIGRLDSDPYDDLIIGAPELNLDDGSTFLFDVGEVYIVPGSAGGANLGGHSTLHQDQPGVFEEREGDDQFGYSLAGVTYPGSQGQIRLAVGVYGDDDFDGLVHLFGTTAGGVSLSGQELLVQDSADTSEPTGFSAFTESLLAADLDGDGTQDLIVGSPSENALAPPAANGGAVQVFYGATGAAAGTIDLTRFSRFWEDAAPINEETESTEGFGSALAAGDFNGDGIDDLVIGAPFDRSGPMRTIRGGAIYVLYGAVDATLIFEDAFESGDASFWQ